MKAPLYDAIIKYKREITSFHMPGHKFGSALSMGEIPLIELDITEVPGLDNLYEAEGIILEAQREMAKKYGAKDTIFLTNGSTSGIIASILSICNPGDSLIVARNCHHSVWNGLILGGVKPIYVNPSYEKGSSLLGGICPAKVEELIRTYPNIKGVIVVSPTYEGLVSDIKSISAIVHKYNKVLIVDEAHGAHFAWDSIFPKSALENGADIVIQSMHKTLPALTQSALLHIGSDRIDQSILISRLQMIQTSSPSYIMMSVMDYMRAYMEKSSEQLWTNYIKNLYSIRERLLRLQNISLLTEDICSKANIYDIDKSKLVILTKDTDITGMELGSILRTQYQIQVEVEAKDYIIAISTIGDTKNNLEILCDALFEIDSNTRTKKFENITFDIKKIYSKNTGSPRDIYFSHKEHIPVEDSEGRVSASNIMEYPPGIPIICIGEIFTKEMILYIKDNMKNLVGIQNKDNHIQVVVSK